MWAIPAAVGGVQAISTLRGARANAGALEGQAGTAQRQAAADESAQRLLSLKEVASPASQA